MLDFLDYIALSSWNYYIINNFITHKSYLYNNINFLKHIFMKNIFAEFQPIFSSKTGFVFGFEGLIRTFYENEIKSAYYIFDVVKNTLLVDEFDFLCREKVIEDFSKLSIKDKKLFLNINPKSSLSPKFTQGFTLNLLNSFGISPLNVVLEITESEHASIEELIKLISYYKSIGFEVALDDFGTGYNSMEFLNHLKVDYVKLPIQVVKGISRSNVKWQLVDAISDLCYKLGIKVVAEGVENEEDLKVLLELNIDYLQGFLLSYPSKDAKINKDGIKILKKNIIDQKLLNEESLFSLSKALIDIERLRVENLSLGKDLIEEIDRTEKEFLLVENEDIFVINVLEAKSFFNNVNNRNIYFYKNVFDLLKSGLTFVYINPKEINYSVSIIAFYAEIEKEHDNRPYLVKNGEKVIGVVTKNSVFNSLFNSFYKTRLYTNPLTGLPGNVLIEKEIEAALYSENKDNLYVVYIDICNFKPFNDNYGFLAGDMMIKKLANELLKLSFEKNFLLVI